MEMMIVKRGVPFLPFFYLPLIEARVSQKGKNIPNMKIELSHPKLPLCRLKLL